MNVLYLTYDGLTDPLGQSQVLPYIVGLTHRGVSFSIISCEKNEAYKAQIKTIKSIVVDNNIKWIPIKYTKFPPVISTIFDVVKIKRQVKKHLNNNNKLDIIHCRSYISALVGLWVKKKYGIPFVFDMRGFWADERIDGNIWSKNNWLHNKIYNYFKSKEQEFLKESNYVISLTKCGKDEISSWNIPDVSPIKVIPCCTDEELFNNTVKAKREELNISSSAFVMSYIGSVGTWYMLAEMLDFFNELLKVKPKAKFLFITKDNPAKIIDLAKSKGIKKDSLIINSAMRNEVPSYIKASDLSIFFIKPLYSKKASSPTKMGEIMNLGVPIVCNSGVGDVGLLMEKTMPNLLIHNFNDSDYKNAIKFVIDKKYDANKIIEEGKQYFSLKKGITSYYDVYKSVLNS